MPAKKRSGKESGKNEQRASSKNNSRRSAMVASSGRGVGKTSVPISTPRSVVPEEEKKTPQPSESQEIEPSDLIDLSETLEVLKDTLDADSFFRKKYPGESAENHKRSFFEFLDVLVNFEIQDLGDEKIFLLNFDDQDKTFESIEIVNEISVLLQSFSPDRIEAILEIYKDDKVSRKINYSDLKSFFWYTKHSVALKSEVRKDNEKEDFVFGYNNIGYCETCKSDTIEVKVVRTAAADEASKVFYTCSKCRSRKIHFYDTSATLRKELQGLS